MENNTYTPTKTYNKKWIFVILAVLVVLFLFSQSIFVVKEAEQAVVSRFGVIKKVIFNDDNSFHTDFANLLENEIVTQGNIKMVYGSGLHFKMPFVDEVKSYSSRLFTYIGGNEVVNTSEKKQYLIQTYAQWTIADPALFELKLGSSRAAENQLDNLILPVIVQAINRLSADDFVSNKEALNEALNKGLATINEDMAIRGIWVKDIQVHQTILPEANIASTYERMEADRAKVAQQTRSEGEEEYRKAVAQADLEVSKILANSVSEAGVIRGEADAQAVEIYANAYSVDKEFYEYWRSLEALKVALNTNSTLVLDSQHPLWSELLTHIQK